MHTDPVLADAALQTGAAGFVPKDAHVDELRLAIREVLAGRRYVSPLVPAHPPQFSLATQTFELGRLTPRQREVLKLLGDGKSTAAIATALNLSPWTVTFHRMRIRKALGIDSEWGLMRYAMLVRLSQAAASAPRSP
jgi:DNA-binding NarL/FixJ family response regulator